MPTESSNVPSPNEIQPPNAPAAGNQPGTTPGIRRQAAEIIDAVLSQTAPENAPVRDQLREHHAANPGRPEVALAEHIASLRVLAAGQSGPGDALPPTAGASRIESVLAHRTLLTAFQPIFDLATDAVVGVEALTRFVSNGSDSADHWFAEASSAQLGSDLEFAALESALIAAQRLPGHLYVALKLSPATCLDPLLPGLLRESVLHPGRTVLQLTETLTDEEPAALASALAPLRALGVRLAIDHVGSYFASIRHVRLLEPEIIKLDRDLIAGIDTDPLRHSFGEAMTIIARQFGASVTAEGIETSDQLAAVTGLGITAGQGYFLGRPSALPRDWESWNSPAPDVGLLTDPDAARRAWL
ncbi:putative signaling protein [Arthrobacter sp. SO5]|uniref:EAL domain-containing protein n=1 Tax=Arthrobacter sp. SO5 TaxID=1897055 RepID=UPI001E2E8A4F|nr:EAL domain-containing protein [Arthrobacter sp. SO5]MCB5275266.1 putative signaling protein [Arthrobacter sp. SO5]